MQVLSEHLTFDQAKVVVESSNEGKDLYMKGICIQGNVKNANQRVYPTFEINKAVQKISDTISGGQSVLGEVDHPEDLKINLDRVSQILYVPGFEPLRLETDNYGYGKSKLVWSRESRSMSRANGIRSGQLQELHERKTMDGLSLLMENHIKRKLNLFMIRTGI